MKKKLLIGLRAYVQIKCWIFLSISFLFYSPLYSQDYNQILRGKVNDLESKQPLIGATVGIYKDSSLIKGGATDVDGKYRIEGIKPGRYSLVLTFIGYNTISVPNVVVTSGKEVIMNFDMEEMATQLTDIVITAKKREANNKMATVSARTFSVEETDRYAGSRGDPARMASNFAGVQGANDSRNDIVIRGNSPLGLLYRMEGVNIPNPNHFGISGSTGGGISILNNKLLSSSDFFTGAFPADYGNAIAGVFDLKMRSGNNERAEYTGQIGVLGTELLAEGPISKEKGSSYLFNYRYSSLSLFQSIGLNIGTDAVPKYQDAAFKLNFPNKKGVFSIFGIGGASTIDIISSKDTVPTENAYSHKNRDQYFKPGMGVLGMNLTRTLDDKTYLKVTISTSGEYQKSTHDKIYRTILANGSYQNDSLLLKTRYDMKQYKQSINAFVNRKINTKHSVRAGGVFEMYSFDFQDSTYNELNYDFEHRLDYLGSTYFAQPYLLWKYKINNKVTLNSGLHAQYLTMNESLSIEPRVGLKWQLNKGQMLALAFGMHSQMQPTYIYFTRDTEGNLINKNLDFTRSNHYVISYDNLIKSNTKVKVEAYYQNLWGVPVQTYASGYSVLNAGDDFTRIFPGELSNSGTATNIGLELTLEKYFNKNYFYMISASVYDAKYKGSDGVEYNSNYNGNFIVNVLGTKEFVVGKENNKTIGLGGKVTWAGGRRYTSLDTLLSDAVGDAVFVDSPRNDQQFKNYFRADVKFNYKVNRPRVTHELGIDLVNVFGTKNFLKQTFTDGNPPEITFDYQLGFLPIVYYKVDF